MSTYEFWDELGNIFNAIVAYQQKTIEFNKRFVNPWLHLGSVFDQDERIVESLQAHKKALEIDQDNAASWLALGDVYFKMGTLDDAADAYSKSIELNPNLGWAYANLALTNAARQKYTEAVNLYVKSLELIVDEKDRAMIWNRLGNVYRKVNDYNNASIAFKMADECDGENTGFEDKFDEVAVVQNMMPIMAEVYVNDNARSFPAEPAPVAEATSQPVETVAKDVQLETVPAQPEELVSESSVSEMPVAEDQAVDAASNGSATIEVVEVTEPEMVAEQTTQVESSVAEAATEKWDTELEELKALIEVVAQEQLVQAPASTDDAQPVETSNANVEAEQSVVEAVAETPVAETIVAETQAESETETPVAESVSAEAQVELSVETPVEDVIVAESLVEAVEETHVAETVSEEAQVEAVENLAEESLPSEAQPESIAEILVEETVPDEITAESESVSVDVSTDTTTTPVMMHAVETFADPSVANQPEDLAEFFAQVSEVEEPVAETLAIKMEDQPEAQVEADEVSEDAQEVEVQPDPVAVNEEVVEALAVPAGVEEIASQSNTTTVEASEPVVEISETLVAEVTNEAVVDGHNEPAYEEFVQNVVEPVVSTAEEPVAESLSGQDVVETSHQTGLKVEPDTKNAHVWNELGNVYFNTGSFEDAITAYSKAIELDDWFAWPYSNLALVYVQKEKYAEALLLYQRSIELFASDKDKAITWNRLGNVYRRLNDYDNAIVCYQRADDLDPNNATISMRSRFSLLGSLSLEASPSLAV